MIKLRRSTFVGRALHGLFVVVGSASLSLACFLVLPLMQAISNPPSADSLMRTVDTGMLPPPPPPPMEEEPEPEEQEEEPPPELMEEAPPLDLEQLELALNAGAGEGWMNADFAVKLNAIAASGDEVDALFNLSDLEQRPRPIYQPSPIMNAKLRSKAPGAVTLIFIVDEKGRVESPIVKSSTDPVFDRPSIAALKKWKFEPGKRQGEAVASRTQVTINFPRN